MEILLTGASGFLGKEIYQSLTKVKENNIITLGRSITNDFIYDLTKNTPEINKKIEIVIHASGRAHYEPKNETEIKEFYDVNTEGTKRLLKGLLKNVEQLKAFVLISTVAVYGKDVGNNISEYHPLEGKTPYAKSKILAEEEVQKFCDQNNINCVILRLPLISGANPPGNLGKMINAIKKGYYFRIGKGEAKKSMVSANDIALILPSLYNKKGIYNLTDGLHPSFKEIEDYICKGLGRRKIITFPKFIFSILAKIGDMLPFFILNSNKLNKITKSLTFSDEKARKELNWKPSSALNAIKF